MSIYGLADCNNFFVSCERVFRPALEGRPAVVLSSNDGCIVARSDEAKALGVKMAQPAFQAKDLIERHSIAVISGNLQFYTDMSNQVMQVFGELVPAVEKYSIDEWVVSDSWWKLVFGVAPDHDGCSIRRRGQSAS